MLGNQRDRNRGSARQRGYTAQWDKASLAYRRANPLCIGCQALGLLKLATVVDHIEPHKGNQALMWDASNWQPCCAWHHNAVKAQLETLYAAGRIDAAALRLDSQQAVNIARKTCRVSVIGDDGWPI